MLLVSRSDTSPLCTSLSTSDLWLRSTPPPQSVKGEDDGDDQQLTVILACVRWTCATSGLQRPSASVEPTRPTCLRPSLQANLSLFPLLSSPFVMSSAATAWKTTRWAPGLCTSSRIQFLYLHRLELTLSTSQQGELRGFRRLMREKPLRIFQSDDHSSVVWQRFSVLSFILRAWQ